MRAATGDQQYIEHPELFRSFPTSLMRRIAPTDPRPTASQVAAFRDYSQAGDPLADALVSEMRELRAGAGRRNFNTALEHGLTAVADPGPALTAFFESVETPPIWLDRDLLRIGAEAVQRTGTVGAYGALIDVSLMGGYLSYRALKVLVRTGEIGPKAPRRVAETALWWMSVTDTDGLERWSPGFKNTLRVRLTHAQIRAVMARREDWDWEAWDHPINQPQMAGTQLLFGLVGLLALKGLGFHFTDREVDGVLHLWRYSGHLIGVDPALLPATEADSWRLLWLLAETEFQPDEDSRALGSALLAAIPALHGIGDEGRAARAAASAASGFHGAITRLAFGGDNGDRLGIPRRPAFTAAVLAGAATIRATETVRRCTPRGTRVALSAGQRSREGWVRHMTPRLQPDATFTREGATPTAAAA